MFDWTPTQTSGVLVVVGVTLTTVQVGLITPMVRRWGEYRTNIQGMWLTAAAIMMIPLAKSIPAASSTLILLSGLVIAVGAAFVQPTASSLVSGLSASTEQGVVLGSLASLTGLMNAIGPITAGLIYDRNPFACFVFEAGFVIVGIALLGKGPEAEGSTSTTTSKKQTGQRTLDDSLRSV
jgi:MFS family permease